MNIDDIIESAQLKGRVIALEAEVKCLEAVIRAHERVDCLSVTSLKKQLVEADAENARLKAEVERFSKPAIIGGYNLSQYIRMANSETLEFDNGDIFADMTLPERIKYIVESHARLKAEVDRLSKKEDNLHDLLNRYALDDMRLTRQVETLRKLGTEMGKHLPDTDEANRAYIDFEAGGKS